MGHNQSRPGNNAKKTADLSFVGIQLPSADPLPVLEEVVAEFSSNQILTNDELSSIKNERTAEGKLKQLLTVLLCREGDTSDMLRHLFESMSEIGVEFSNLPDVLNVQYQSIQEIQRDGKGCLVRTVSEEDDVIHRRTASCLAHPHHDQHKTAQQIVLSPLPDDLISSRSFSLSHGITDSLTIDEMADDLLESSIEFRHKRAVVIVMDPSDQIDADKLHSMLTSGHTSAVASSSPEPSLSDHKVVEVLYQLSRENATLVRAVISQPSKPKTNKRKKQQQKPPQQNDSVLFKELKRKVMEGLLKKGGGTGSNSYPLSMFIKAQNVSFCRDFFSVFLMGSNSLYLFIYNWREETVVFNGQGGSEISQLNEEVLKWVHTIGSTTASLMHPTPTVSAMVVATKFEELVNKTAGECQAAKQVGNASTHKLCEKLRGHKCAAVLDSKPILLSKDDSQMRGEADILMKKLADSNFSSKSVNPRWVHLLSKICGRKCQPILHMEDFFRLASSGKLGKKEALSALNYFKEAKMVFYLADTSKCELKGIIFTDLEWLVNTLVGTLSPPPFQARGTLWQDWEDLTKKGIMSADIKRDIENKTRLSIPTTNPRLPDEWVFSLLNEINLFTDISTNEKVKGFCPLYLPLCGTSNSTEANEAFTSSSTVPSIYLRPSTGCVTDQYTMRLFCSIIRSGVLSLQVCQSRTLAIFLLKKHNLRFTISCSMDCIRINVESSFTGKPIDSTNGPKAAQMLISHIVRASKDLGETWYPVQLTDKTTPDLYQAEIPPNRYFQCYDRHCSYSQNVHLSKVINSSENPHLECQLSGQCCMISEAEKFWVDDLFCENGEKLPQNTRIESKHTRRRAYARKTRAFSSSQEAPTLKLRASPVTSRTHITSLYMQSANSVEPQRKSYVGQVPPMSVTGQSLVTSPTSPTPIGEKHILDRCFKVMIDHLGVDMVAIKMMELKLMEPAQALSICNKDSYKSIAERAEAVSSITRVVQDKGPQAFTTFIRILEQTGISYLSHQKIIEELQQDPSYASYLK